MNENNKNINRSVIKVLFNQKTCEYNLFHAKGNSVKLGFIPKDFIKKEALVYTKTRFDNIKFTGLNTLIDYCKANKIPNLQIVLEWINFFIYKEERKFYDQYRSSDSSLVIGINNIIPKIKQEKEESLTQNGYKYYISESRSLIIKLLEQLVMQSDVFNYRNESNTFINSICLNILNLNFDEAYKLLKEASISKDTNQYFITIFIEVINHFYSSHNNTYFTLNDSIKNIIGTFDKLDLSSLPYLVLFIQHNLIGSKLNEFMQNEEISIFLKLIYLFKNATTEDLIFQIKNLEKFYTEKGFLEGLILTGGNSKNSIQLIQNYLDSSDDLLVSTILSKFFIDSKENSLLKYENELFDILNQMNMFNERLHLNQKLNEIVSHMEKGHKILNSCNESKLVTVNNNANGQFVLKCFYCNIKISADRADQLRNTSINYKDGEIIDFCVKCLKKLPNCAICLCPIEINMPVTKVKTSHTETKREKEEETKSHEMKYLWCTKCRHGGHLDHIKDWFVELMICPVADCNCICLEYNHIFI